jgi:hypothetical protein
MKPMSQLFSIITLRKLHFIRDTVVLLTGAFLAAILAYNYFLDIAVVIIVLTITIGAAIVKILCPEKADTFVSGALKGFAYFMDQVASLFLGAGITILAITRNIMGVYAFLALVVVGLLMEGAIAPIKVKKATKMEGGTENDIPDISDKAIEKALRKILKRTIAQKVGILEGFPESLKEATANYYLGNDPAYTTLVLSYVTIRSQERNDRNNRIVQFLLVLVSAALVVVTLWRP